MKEDSDTINLETSPSEQKHHSRIEIKKGPNGQDYEYEYVYYYYDEDEPTKIHPKDDSGNIPFLKFNISIKIRPDINIYLKFYIYV